MTFDHIDGSSVGICGEHLVCIDLMSIGHKAFLVGEGLSYDLILDAGGVIYRVQVKTTMKVRKSPFSGKETLVFDCRKRSHNRSRIKYIEGDYDILALVDLNNMTVGYFLYEDTKKFMTVEKSSLSEHTLKNCILSSDLK